MGDSPATGPAEQNVNSAFLTVLASIRFLLAVGMVSQASSVLARILEISCLTIVSLWVAKLGEHSTLCNPPTPPSPAGGDFRPISIFRNQSLHT